MHTNSIELYRVILRNERRVRSSCVLFSTGVPVRRSRFAQATCQKRNRSRTQTHDKNYNTQHTTKQHHKRHHKEPPPLT